MNNTKRHRLRALSLSPVSRETANRFAIFIDRMTHWTVKTNLISGGATSGNVWMRHIADSAQLLLIHPKATRWLDIGSGAGFPGMVLAMQLADVPGAIVHCVERNQRKCAFLREAARATQAPVVVHPARVESLSPSTITVDGITARALAPLSTTLIMARPWLCAGAIGIFPCGSSMNKQFYVFPHLMRCEIKTVHSVVDATASIIRVRLH